MNPIYNVCSLKSFANPTVNDSSIIISSCIDFESQINPEILLYSFLSQTPPPYQLTLPLDDLLTSHPKLDGTIPRPKNSFMLFREDYNAKIKACFPLAPNMTVSKTSIIVSQEWEQQPPSVLQFFEILSMVANQRHKAMYPNYKFAPQRKSKESKFSKSSPTAFIFVDSKPLPTLPTSSVNLNPITTPPVYNNYNNNYVETPVNTSTESLNFENSSSNTFEACENFAFYDEDMNWIDEILGII
jgi:hypothetical protein